MDPTKDALIAATPMRRRNSGQTHSASNSTSKAINSNGNAAAVSGHSMRRRSSAQIKANDVMDARSSLLDITADTDALTRTPLKTATAFQAGSNAGRGRIFRFLVGFASLIFAFFIWSKWRSPSSSGLTHPCNPFTAPGRFLVNLTFPLSSHWKPYNETDCPPLPDYLSALWSLTHGPDRPTPKRALSTYSDDYRAIAADPMPRNWPSTNYTYPTDAIKFLRQRRRHPATILLLGDSVDRNGLIHFCQLMKRKISISLYENIDAHPPGLLPEDLTVKHGSNYFGYDQRGLPHLCEIPFYDETKKSGTNGVALRIVNGFHYGFDTLDEFNTADHKEWHSPGRLEVRINELVVPLMEQFSGAEKIDLIQFHSGMWDLALFGQQDDRTRWSLNFPLSKQQLEWYKIRMTQTIKFIRQSFPQARVVIRKLHRAEDNQKGTSYITNLRVHQLRNVQEQVARSLGIPIFDFGHVFDGYQHFQDKVHPHQIPGGIMYAQNLMYQLELALASKFSWRRKSLLN